MTKKKKKTTNIKSNLNQLNITDAFRNVRRSIESRSIERNNVYVFRLHRKLKKSKPQFRKVTQRCYCMNQLAVIFDVVNSVKENTNIHVLMTKVFSKHLAMFFVLRFTNKIIPYMKRIILILLFNHLSVYELHGLNVVCAGRI